MKSYNHVFRSVEDTWAKTIDSDASGLIHHCTRSKNGSEHENGIMLRRTDNNFLDRLYEAKRQVNYLAKERSKMNHQDGMRNFGMSRLPKNMENSHE